MASNRKIALITGVNGQDGSYLAELLLSKGYDVHGTIRRSSLFNRSRIDQTRQKAHEEGLTYDLHYADLTDFRSLERLIRRIKPDELYNLAAQSHIGVSFEQPEMTAEINGLGTLRLLETLRDLPETRMFEACSSEMFGDTKTCPQNEETAFQPLSPYAISKQFSFSSIRTYRRAYNVNASAGILYNHESPRRGENFVTRKIVRELARLHFEGRDRPLALGNLNASRDWGYSEDYVRAMWMILQQEQPGDYVIATGKAHSVRDFVDSAIRLLDIELEWENEGLDEVGRDPKTGEIWVHIDPRYFRPLDHTRLVGDASKARNELGWEPSVNFDELVALMMQAELDLLGTPNRPGPAWKPDPRAGSLSEI